MQLSKIKADIRLRGSWEAIDLGFAMVQVWAKTIYSPWIIVMAFFGTVIWFIAPFIASFFDVDKQWVAPLMLWWFKPVYDRFLLYIISQELFSFPVGIWQSLKKMPSLIRNNGLFSGLTYRRFSLSRGFNLPIWQLEGLKGLTRKKRQNLLHSRAHSQAVWLTIACIHFEIIIFLAFFGFILLWLPDQMQQEFFQKLIGNEGNMSSLIEVLSYVIAVIAIIIIEPFYIAGSFSLYINRRTQLEAWDIELVFRHMADRLSSMKTGVKKLASVVFAFILTTSILALSLPTAMAEESAAKVVLPVEKSKSVITDLMQTEALKHKIVTETWQRKEECKSKDKDDDQDDDSGIGDIFGVIIRFGLWILLVVAIITLIVYREKWIGLFNGDHQTKEQKARPDVLFGMDIRPDSLPDDIPTTAQKLWQDGQQREALSLLYRGALMQLVNKDDVPLEDSHTEGDILKISRKILQEQREQYLEKLTNVWRQTAYAHRFPSDAEAQYLFDHWNIDFSIVEESTK